MANKTTLDQLSKSVMTYAEDCSDNLVTLNKFTFPTVRDVRFPVEGNLFTQDTAVQGTMNDWAFRQMAERLDAPATRWLGDTNHCPDALGAHILNELAQVRPPDRLLVRGKGNTVRAVLSDEYTVFDNKDLIHMIEQAVSDSETKIEVWRPEVGDELRVYILLPEITFAPDPSNQNGGLHPAVYVSNSERGGGRAKICSALFRQVCTNGLIMGYRTNEIFAVVHRFISTTSMSILVSEAIAKGFQMSEAVAKMFIESQTKHLTLLKVKDLVSTWSTQYGISLDASEGWLNAVKVHSDPTVYDVVNGATLVAQTRAPEEREQLEIIGGDLLYAEMRRPQEN